MAMISFIASLITILLFIFKVFKYFSLPTKPIVIESKRLKGKIKDKEIKRAIKRKKLKEIRRLPIYEGTTSGNTKLINKYINDNEKLITSTIVENQHISVFGNTEMPILIWLGSKIKESAKVGYFRRLRNASNNPWSRFSRLRIVECTEKHVQQFFKTNKVRASAIHNLTKGAEINLVIEYSFKINTDEVEAASQCNESVILGVSKTSNNKLMLVRQLNQFKYQYKKLFEVIDSVLGKDGVVHLFCTVPTPFAIIIGQYIHESSPKVIVYDSDGNSFSKIITIN